MTSPRRRSSLIRLVFPALAGAVLGGFLGFASAQDGVPGQLDNPCNARCTANGYEVEFCQSVCWVPDPVEAAEGDRLDWKCFESCDQRGGKARACLASCRR